MIRTTAILFAVVLFFASTVWGQTNSFSHLDEYCDPYYPGTDFPKLITPQWVGEDGVEVVVTLGIDDMRDTAKYENYLRPILERLKKIDGRAPVSIMTCSVDPKDPQLKTWVDEGLSIEVHTVDHPCPCLQAGDFDKAKSTYERCVDLMASIPGNAPVAFRMPCCDSQNTPSPRFWVEVFNRKTSKGNFLQADSSVFNVFTSADATLQKNLTVDPDGSPKFKKYIPFPSFVNTIENYPYPYVIAKRCWQFPCVVPSDWEAQNLHRPNNPKTVEDMKAAIDATVIKQGMFNLVFHPHGWIRNDQVNELIDYAQTRYGKRVKFLTFKECVERINKNLLANHPVRNPATGSDNGVRIADLNQDGFMDVVIGNDGQRLIRIWDPNSNQWSDSKSNIQVVSGSDDLGVRFGRLTKEATASIFVNNDSDKSLYHLINGKLVRHDLPDVLKGIRTSVGGVDQGVRLRDLDGDGITEVIHSGEESNLPFEIVDEEGRDNGVRFVDLDNDGFDDVVWANGLQTAIRLYDSEKKDFSRIVDDGKPIPPIVRNGTNNGVWFAKDHLWVQNEDTHRLPDLVDRRSFAELLGSTEPGPQSPDKSHGSIKLRDGFTVELVAAEPLVMDPIAIDWGPDKKLWVVEMADYPLGMDDKGKPGGRVRYLEDTNGDGKYDKSTLFLDDIAYPTGVIAWRDGVIVSAAPAVFFAADRDGDGRAEHREDLFRGFGEGNQQHRVNGFERGLDNWLYLANGDSGGKIESVKTGTVIDLGGQDLRVRPNDGSMDLQSGRTQFGRHRDDRGNWFGCSNPIPVRHFVLADHYLRRNPHIKFPAPRLDIANVGNTQLFPISRVLSHWSGYKPPSPGTGHKFTSACSTTVYRDQLFGEAFADNTFTCEPVHNAVHRRKLIPNDVMFESVRPSDEVTREFLASSDSWFRPTTATTGPDGALWITDMYRLVIEHPEWIDDEREKQLFLRAGHDRGRIYRVYPTHVTPREVPKFDKANTTGLVELLTSPNGRVRDLAQHLLIEGDDENAIAPLKQLVRESDNPLARLHAICTLDGMKQIDEELLTVALYDSDATVRRHAIRISEGMVGDNPDLESIVVKLLQKIDTADAHVQLQLAYSLGEFSSRAAVLRLASLAIDSADDPYIRAAVVSSLNAENLESFYSAFAENDAALEIYRPQIMDMALRLNVVPLLSSIVDSMLSEMDQKNPAVEQIQLFARMVGEIRRWNAQVDPNVERKMTAIVSEFSAKATDKDSSEELRVAGIGLISALGDSSSDILHLVSSSEPLSIQVAAARGVTKTHLIPLLERFQSLSPAVRSAILNEVIARESTSLTLLVSLREDRIPRHIIDSQYRQKLRSHPSKKVQSIAGRIFSDKMENPTPTSDLLKRYVSAVTPQGSSETGLAVFVKECAACHRLSGVGHAVGPDLAAVKNRSPQAMLTAILDPNAAVEDKYRSYAVLTVDGEAMAGIIQNESSTSIELRLQDGKSRTILRDDIEQIQSTGKSLMPEGIHKNVSPAAMNDLLAFLNDLRPPPKSFAGNRPTMVRPDDSGVITLTAGNARIYGDQIRFESKYRNIGFWGDENDFVQWTLQIDEPKSYEVTIEYACPKSAAGNEFHFECGDQIITQKVEDTGTWDGYRSVSLGTIELKRDNAFATVQSTGQIRGWLFDLKKVTLKPKE